MLTIPTLVRGMARGCRRELYRLVPAMVCAASLTATHAEEPKAGEEKKAEAKWSVAGLKDFDAKVTETENGVSVTFTVSPEAKRPFFGFVRKFDPPVAITSITGTVTGVEEGCVVELRNDKEQGCYRHMPPSGEIFFDMGTAVVKGKGDPFEGKITSISIGMAAPKDPGEHHIAIENFRIE